MLPEQSVGDASLCSRMRIAALAHAAARSLSSGFAAVAYSFIVKLTYSRGRPGQYEFTKPNVYSLSVHHVKRSF